MKWFILTCVLCTALAVFVCFAQIQKTTMLTGSSTMLRTDVIEQTVWEVVLK